MQPLRWNYRPDHLRAPALVCGFKGWNDAGDAASSAVSFVGDALGAREFATIDPEDFYDFQATRPRITLTDDRRLAPSSGPTSSSTRCASRARLAT